MPAPEPPVPDSVDLLVLGGGMAGLTAAARAAQDGARVLVVEVASELGGSTRFAGYAWTAPSREVIDEVVPLGDPELRHALVDRFSDGIEWIRSLDVHVGEAQPILGFGTGHAFDTNQYVDTCRRRVLERGEVLTSTRTLGLLLEDGSVLGARLQLPDGSVREVRAGATALATGGFQADPELRAAHVHPNAATIPLRSNPNSRGDGLRLAREVGAATGPDGAGFYGHLIPSGIPFADSGDFVGLSLYYSEHALLFNLANERFVDESVGDHLSTMALLEEPEARALLVADARVHRDWIVAAYVAGAESSDKFAVASRRGGRCGIAESLDELALLPEEWGYDGAAIAEAIAAYNETVGAGEDPAPGRRLDRLPLDEPPYYVIETIPAITFPFYGIRIDASARVLDESGAPIPGLLAAGSDTGGLYVRAYAGGIASALVFGLTAAKTALTYKATSTIAG
jgi:succinate dehydrogenase/fumarate reductase flavoprotein subunit